jgi:HEAT repeat protein
MKAIAFACITGLLLAAAPSDAVPRLLVQLKDADPEKRKEAAEDLGHLGVDATSALGALVVAFKDDNVKVRVAAVDAVRSIGPEVNTKTTIPALIDVLKNDKNEEVRRLAAKALGREGLEPKTVVPALTDALKDGDAGVRKYAVFGLKIHGKDAKSAVPAVIDVLKNDKNEEVRCIAADTLGKVGADAEATVSALAAAVKAGGEAGIHAAKALTVIGPDAKAAIPELTAALQDKTMRPFAAQTLARFKGDGLAVLVKALDDKDDDLRVEVVVALRLAGKDGVPGLQTGLKDKFVEVRLNAADSLGRLGAEAKDAVPALIKALKDEIPDVRAEAATALGRIGADAKDAEPALTDAKKDAAELVRQAAEAALDLIKRKK